MASTYFVPLTEVKGVPAASASGTIRVELPTTGRVLNIKSQIARGAVLATLAQIRAAITEVRLILGAEVVRRWSAAEMLAVQEGNNFAIEDGLLAMFLAEPWRATVMDEELLSLDLRNYASAALELDVTNDATALSFNFNWKIDDRAKVGPNGQPVRGMLGWTAQTENIGGGEPIFKLDPLNGALQRLWLVTPNTTTVTRVRVLAGETPFYDLSNTTTNPSLKHQLKDMGMKIPTAYVVGGVTYNVWPIVFDNNQQLRAAIGDTGGLRLQVTHSTGATVRILRETQIDR